MTTADRVLILERQVRWLQRSLVVAMVALISLFALGAITPQAPVAEVLRARRLEIISKPADPAGQERTVVSLSADQLGGVLQILNEKGERTVALCNNLSGGTLLTSDKSGSLVAAIEPTVAGCGAITTYGPQRSKLVQLGATLQGDGMVETSSAKGTRLALVTSTTSGNGVLLTYSPEGKHLVSIGSGSNGGGSILVNASSGEQAVRIEQNGEFGGIVSTAGVVLARKNGTVAGALGIINGAGTLELADINGANRFTMTTNSESAALSINDTDGKTRLLLDVDASSGSVAASGSGSNGMAVLHGESSAPGLIIFDDNRKPRLTVANPATGPSMEILGSDGQQLILLGQASTPNSSDRFSVLRFRDFSKRIRAALVCGNAGIELLAIDESGKVTSKWPPK